MSFIKLKQISGPTGESNNGATIVFENNTPKWTSSNTGALLLPSGNTTARPTGLNGHIRFNSETNRIEAYENGTWKNVISDSELLKRYSFKINFNSSQQPTSAENLPDGWTVSSFTGNSFVLTHNVGKIPFAFNTQGWNSDISRFQHRAMTNLHYFNTDPLDTTKVYFVGVGATVAGTVANGYAYYWLLF
jgi:hypothetical protein